MDDSVYMCDETIESFDGKTKILIKKATCKMQNFYVLVAFSLINIALLIDVSIFCYLIKC